MTTEVQRDLMREAFHQSQVVLKLEEETTLTKEDTLMSSRNWQSKRDEFSSGTFGKICPAKTLVSAQEDPCWTADLQKHKI